MSFLRKVFPAAAWPVLVLAPSLILAGCGGGETTVTVPTTVATTATTGSPTAEKKAYKDEIEAVSRQADNMNVTYRDLIKKHGAGQVTTDQLVNQAQQDVDVYENLVGELTTMKVPPEFRSTHGLLISACAKWQAAFEDYRDGFRDNDQADLDRASELDDQAVIEVNQAISAINQVE